MLNIKIRLKNRTFLVTFLIAVVTFVYQILGMFGVVPSVTQDIATTLVMSGVNLLALLGIVVDPTTEGVKDSQLVLDKKENE